MEKLNIDDFKEEEIVFDPAAAFAECLINPDEELTRPPIAISIGYKYEEQVPLVTYGNFCCIVGASKSMKSFLKSAFLACAIGGQAQNYFPDVKGHDVQGKYHVQRVVKRVNTMVGKNYGGYKGLALRPKTPKERVAFIEWILTDSDFAGKIAILSIDGVADLIEDVNDLKSSNEITQKLMTWSNDYNIAIITILHKNFDSAKPTGHLGSAVLKKAETTVFVTKDDDIVTVNAKYSRNIPFDDFKFSVDEKGIPFEAEKPF